MRPRILAFESIAHQGPAFFNAITDALFRIQAETKYPVGPAFFHHPNVLNLLEVIKDFTGLTIEYDENYKGRALGIVSPYITINHIFFTGKDVNDGAQDWFKKQIAGMSKPYFKGTVDLVKSRVTGEFTKLKSTLYVGRDVLLHNALYGANCFSPQEIAAGLLHEIGHAFIAIEYANRVTSTNQVLAGVNDLLRGCQPAEREIVFAHASEVMRMTPEQKKAFEKCEDDQGRAISIAAISAETCVSELGGSVFDTTSCEQLADQFAMRHGAGKHLVMLTYAVSQSNPQGEYWNRQVRSAAALAFLALFPLTTYWALKGVYASLKAIDKSNDLYGSLHSRLSRVRGEAIDRLKDLDISETEREQQLGAVQMADQLLALESNKLELLETLAYYVKPSFRSAHKFEMLQRQLEAFAHNGLFAKAAKLRSL